jgi:transposase
VDRTRLTDAQWATLLSFLKAHPRVYVGDTLACRRFLDAVLWVLRSGAQWRLLPEERGVWNSTFKRFSRWQKHGVWNDLQQFIGQDPDLQQLLIDSTVVRAHPCAAGAASSTADQEALGRSRGGFSTKIHAVTDALGNPLAFVLTGGQASDIGQAQRLITPLTSAAAVIADKGYDANELVIFLDANDMEAVIPPRSNRLNPRPYDQHAYKERPLVECFFNKIKHYRRIFSRYEKMAKNFMAFLHFVSFLIWTR